MTTRVLVTGSRDWSDAQRVREALSCVESEAAGEPLTLVHGDCPTGADAIADKICRGSGAWEVERYPADWNAHGRAAGPIRNKAMVDLGADLCIAFVGDCTSPRCTRTDHPHDSHGATGCARLAENAGIPVRYYRQREA